jgi:hypothetical protein
VNSLPSLPTHNHFDVLSIQESIETVETIDKVMQDLQPSPKLTPTSLLHLNSQPKWEKKLPSKFITAAMEGITNSLKVKVELETMDTAKVKSTSALVDSNALVDSGATGEFID